MGLATNDNQQIKDITMNRMICSAAFVSLALMMNGSGAHAFGNACRRVNFSVDNNVGQPITVKKFELYSASEGRWLNEDFKNVTVPKAAKDYVVRKGETVEYGENDNITSIRVAFEYVNDKGNTLKRTSQYDHPFGTCVADRWFKAVVSLKTVI